MKKTQLVCIPFVVCALLTPSQSKAANFLFDFEKIDPPGDFNAAQFTALTLKDTTDKISATITRSSGNSFSVTDLTSTPIGPCDSSDPLSSCPPNGWGTRTLSPFNQPSTANDYFIITFPQPVATISIEGGDRNFDFDTIISLTALNGSNVLGVASGLPNTAYTSISTLPEIRTISYATSPLANIITSIHLFGGSPEGSSQPPIPPEPISFYWDNLKISTVDDVPPTPVPAPLPVLGAGVCFAYTRKIRRRIKQSLTQA